MLVARIVDKHQFPGIGHCARRGASGRAAGGDLDKGLGSHTDTIQAQRRLTTWRGGGTLVDVACGQTIVFSKEQAGQVPGLRVPPVKVVQEREKLRLIHFITSEHRNGQGRGGGCTHYHAWP